LMVLRFFYIFLRVNNRNVLHILFVPTRLLVWGEN